MAFVARRCKLVSRRMVHAVVDGARGYFQSGIEMCHLKEEIGGQAVMETRASSNVRGKGKTYTGYKRKKI